MTLSEKIEKEYIESYKAKDAVRLGVLRLLKTAVKNRLVDLRRPGGALSDEEMLDVIVKQAKQRQDSIEQYTLANRKDLADKEQAELEILKMYLPKTLDAAELDQAIDEAIRETGAAGPQDMGKIMAHIMAKHKGRVDGKAASAAVRSRLTPKA